MPLIHHLKVFLVILIIINIIILIINSIILIMINSIIIYITTIIIIITTGLLAIIITTIIIIIKVSSSVASLALTGPRLAIGFNNGAVEVRGSSNYHYNDKSVQIILCSV